VVAGSVPWLAYLGCLAYVELGMMLFAAVAAGLVLDHFCNETGTDWRTALAAGLYAGLSAGCKYTALLLVPAAFAVAWLAVMRGPTKVRATRLALFAAGTILAFGPWLIRNAAFTGNPVYPFAYGWLDGTAWSAEQAEQWDRGHRLLPEQDSVTGRLKVSANDLLGSRMFGPALLPLALVGLALTRSRPAAMLAIWSLIIVAGWATLTHMPGRFVLPVIVPLALLAGLATGPAAPDRWRRMRVLTVSCVAFAGAILNSLTLAGLLHRHAAWWARQGLPLNALLGDTETLARAQPVNQMIPPNGYAWLVGEARAFYLRPRVHYTVAFSRDPWLTYASDATAAESVAWLRTRNVSHVVFSWGEIGRLRATYGFPALVTRGWVQSLAAAGLRLVELFPDADTGDIEVYEVLPG
jgi:4-amino-4-deoxy-L-arabinose transferase-like glycosyltransferase